MSERLDDAALLICAECWCVCYSHLEIQEHHQLMLVSLSPLRLLTSTLQLSTYSLISWLWLCCCWRRKCTHDSTT